MPDEGAPRLIAQNTEADRARKLASGQVSWALRDMTANLLRVVRGAGKPNEIVNQTSELLKALVAYRDTVGHPPPPDELAEILSIERTQDWRSGVAASAPVLAEAEDRAVRGALQIAASRLIEQPRQEQSGAREMRVGIRDIEAALATMRRERDAAYPRGPVALSKRPGKPKG